MIKYWCLLFLSVFFVIPICYAENNKLLLIKDLDRLNNMVSSSDFIGVVRISQGASPYSKMPKEIKKMVEGEIIESIFDKSLIGKTLLINSIPANSKGSEIIFPVFLRNGTFLVFLKNSHKDFFQPLSSDSLMRVVNERVLPVWQKKPPNKKVLPPKLEDVLAEIGQIIKSEAVKKSP